MRRLAALVLFVFLLAPKAMAFPDGFRLDKLRPGNRNQVHKLNQSLAGKIIDFTDNHECDRRIESSALGCKRDLYVYTPPGYDGKTPYPFFLWLHQLGQDERTFLNVIPEFDEAMRCGRMPRMVIACPDGSISGRPSFGTPGSFYVNSRAGNFEDYIMQDVWNFVMSRFAICPEREAHVIAGASMGGFGAFNLGFKYREQFGHIVGIMPPLNMRYGDCHGRYRSHYDPNCYALRNTDRRLELIGKFYGVILIRSRRVLDPLVGRRGNATSFVAAENPLELLVSRDIRPGEFGMFIGYGKKDEFNLDAQIESFLDEAARRGIRPTIAIVPNGHHDATTARSIFPALCDWLNCKLQPFVESVPLPYCVPRLRRDRLRPQRTKPYRLIPEFEEFSPQGMIGSR